MRKVFIFLLPLLLIGCSSYRTTSRYGQADEADVYSYGVSVSSYSESDKILGTDTFKSGVQGTVIRWSGRFAPAVSVQLLPKLRTKSDIPFFSAGAGVAYSNIRQTSGYQMGGNLFFVEEVSTGIRIGKYAEVGYIFRHISNAGLGGKNRGMNSHFLEIWFGF